MSSSERVQAPRTAWMNAMRAEALRMNRPEVSKIVHIGWVIASYADSDGTNACPKTETIAAIVGSSDETVSRAKKVLKALGVLVEKRRPNTNSEYRLQPVLGDSRLDWDAHLHLYTDTPQARHKRKKKEREIAEHLARREQELARTPSQNGVRNPFPQGVPDGPEPVPAGGSETPSQESGTRRGTGSEPVAERGPEPVPAGGEQRELHKGPDKEGAGPSLRPPVSPGQGPERRIRERGKETGLALAPDPTPRGRTRKSTAAATIQPPLLLAVHGQPSAIDGIHQPHTEDGLPAPHQAGGQPQGDVPAELSMACRYCEAPEGARCRNTVGLRGIAHQSRLDDWALTFARCPHCRAATGALCTSPDGSPQHGIHAARADLGDEMRAIAGQLHQSETGT
ncbi:helix-turn-helix domain-containing protein [Streptomyces sp. NPDC005385]|uniref:zinc finger domain-containing protein n=1 Tax=Streptomyces sp. NPDC005385 TaxID=3157039 RepID=UPI0033A4C53F